MYRKPSTGRSNCMLDVALRYKRNRYCFGVGGVQKTILSGSLGPLYVISTPLKGSYRSHATNCGATWFCHIPFCPEVKEMPSFEWLKIKEGETKGNPHKFQEFPNHFWLISYKRMHDICMLVNARNILEWPVLSVNLAAAKLQK